MTAHTTLSQIDQFEAARTGNLQWFKQQHAAGTLPDLTIPNAQNRLAFEYAVENGHLDVVKYLIEDSGQDVDVTAFDNCAIRFGAANGHLHVIKYLFEESGQDVDAAIHVSSVIRCAAENGHLNVVKYLSERSDRDVDDTSRNDVAIRDAAANGHLSIVKYLIEKTTQNITVTPSDRVSASYACCLAAASGHLSVVKYLIEESGQNVDATISNNYAIRYAVMTDHLSVVKYLIEECPQYIDLPEISQTLLQTAVEHEHSELVEYLTPICEATKTLDSIVYKKIRPILVNLEDSNALAVNTVTVVNNDTSSKKLPNNTSEISKLIYLSFTDKLQRLSTLPGNILQALSASAEGLQQLRAYLQKTSNDTTCMLATKNQVPRF